MNNIKAWSATSQQTVGQIVSRLRYFLKPAPRLKALEHQTGRLHVEGLTMPVDKLGPVPRPFPRPPRGTSLEKVSFGRDPAGEPSGLAKHTITLPDQPRKLQTPHLSALMRPDALTEKSIQTIHLPQRITRADGKPNSIQILLDPETYTSLLHVYSALFKSSREPVKGTKTRPLHSTLSLKFPSSSNEALLDRSPLITISSADHSDVSFSLIQTLLE
jgi:hypothetical protein